MKLHSTARTDVGRTRDHNEDTFGLGEGEAVEHLGELLVVCDGMGGHASGEVASQLAVATILEIYYADQDEDRPAALERAFTTANARVYTQGRGTMGTTGVAAVLHHDALHVANVGDSRGYLIRDGSIRQITRDHSFVSDQIAAGLLTPEQARISAHRNIITRALGHQADVSVDLFRWPLQIGDVVLLCSDGLHGLIEDDELLQVVQQEPLDDVADVLVDLANARGGTDNITVVVARVDALDWDTQPVVDDTPTERLSERSSARTAQITETIVPPPAVALAATQPNPVAPQPRKERRLSLLGALLAALLLAALLFAIVFVYLAPTPTSAPTPVPTLVATSAAVTPASTAGPNRTATPTAP